MSVGKSVSLVLGICFLCIFLAGCEGDTGPIGPPGFTGTEGPPGSDFVPDPIADQVIGLMVVNAVGTDMNGAARITVTSREDAAPSATQVVAALMATAPVIDGRTSSANEWALVPLSSLQLTNLFGADNGISAADVQMGYDRANIYMRIRWTEVEGGAFLAAADTTWKMWTFDGSQWSQGNGDDKLFLVWETSPITGWDANGLTTIFDGTTFKTPAAGEQADLWMWSGTRTNYAGVFADKNVVYSTTNGEQDDFGIQYFIENTPQAGLPAYMKTHSPKVGSTYPLWAFEYGPFVNTIDWEAGATIPGVITLQPSVSAADVRAAAVFANGTWTVELRRVRNTGHHDDVVL